MGEVVDDDPVAVVIDAGTSSLDSVADPVVIAEVLSSVISVRVDVIL